MPSPAAITVLRALRDLADANGATRDIDAIKRRGAAPTRSELAQRAGVDADRLGPLVDELAAESLVTRVERVAVVTILGRAALDAAAGLEASP